MDHIRGVLVWCINAIEKSCQELWAVMILSNGFFVFSTDLAMVIYGNGAQSATFSETRSRPGIVPGNLQNPTSY